MQVADSRRSTARPPDPQLSSATRAFDLGSEHGRGPRIKQDDVQRISTAESRAAIDTLDRGLRPQFAVLLDEATAGNQSPPR